MALFKKSNGKLPERPDNMSDEDYIRLLISEDKDYDKHNDGSHIDNLLVLTVMNFVESHVPELSDRTKLRITSKLVDSYHAAQEWTENADGTKILTTGNSEDELNTWLADDNNTSYILNREYRKDTTSEEVGLKLFQIANVQETLAKQQLPDFEMRLSKHMLWQTDKTAHMEADADFLNFLIDNHPVIAGQLVNMPDIESISADTWYCRIVALFGIKYYPDEEYTERYKYQITADWIAQCPEMAECLYDLWEQMIFADDYMQKEFNDFWDNKDTASDETE